MSWSTRRFGIKEQVARDVDADLAVSQASYERSSQAPGDVSALEAADVAAVRARIAASMPSFTTSDERPHVEIAAWGSRSASSVTVHLEIVTIPPRS